MDFMRSQTIQNLARSFAGESQARTRYTIYAHIAREQHQEYLARLFDHTAENERAHAQAFLRLIQTHSPQPLENLDICAGYPYTLGITMENLLQAAHGEEEEFKTIYPAFAATARSEGYSDAAALWERIAQIEGVHSAVFREAYAQLQTGALYQKDTPTVWRCLECGYIAHSNQPWEVCPVCGKPRGWVAGDIEERRLPSA